MKKQITIKKSKKKYSIFIQENSIINTLKLEFRTKNKVYIIIDKKLKTILNNIKKSDNIYIIKVKASEKIKSIDSYWKIILILLKLQIDRSSTLIAIGGGTLGDLAGFISSTILRGIRFILMPTTLLSQVDSSIGGKNGINSIYGKNLIGTFKQPDKVVIDPSILNSLSLKELKSGYAEILKHALINDKIFYNWLNKNYNKILILDEIIIKKAIVKSIEIKSKYVERDEKEKLINSSSRALLNFGHTFGHALETMNNYNTKLTHGEAISIGMAISSKISYKIGNISKSEYENIINHLKKAGLPYFDKRIRRNTIFKLIMLDKKNTNNIINLILLKKIGQAYYHRDLSITKVKKLLK